MYQSFPDNNNVLAQTFLITSVYQTPQQTTRGQAKEKYRKHEKAAKKYNKAAHSIHTSCALMKTRRQEDESTPDACLAHKKLIWKRSLPEKIMQHCHSGGRWQLPCPGPATRGPRRFSVSGLALVQNLQVADVPDHGPSPERNASKSHFH